MAKFLTTRGTISEIECIINNAKNGFVLISPFIKIPDSLFQNMRAADQRGVIATLVYGKNELEQSVKEQLSQLKNVKLYYLKNLHAKCFFNEQSMVITSLNLYDFSEQNNREMGVLVTRTNDMNVYNEAVREADIIISLSARSDFNVQVNEPIRKPPNHQPNAETKKQKSIWFKDLRDIFPSLFGGNYGYCIGCETKIERDEFKPYCSNCYKEWAKDKSQKAKYCHWCGKVSSTSINKPLCRSCFGRSS